jgi:hypothetical protein
MAIYSTLYGLPQSMVDYLNQPLPDISGLSYTPAPTIEAPTIEDVITEEGIASLYPEVVASGGGDSFSPYNIRPGDSSIRTSDQYSPYAYRQASEKSYVGDPNGYGYRTNTEAQKMMDNYPDYYRGKPLTGIEQLLSKIPTPFGFIKKGLDALADKLPVNKAAIFQNELLGQGIKLDSLGRIVTDNYNTPQGIMAGYNTVSGGLLNMLTGGAYGEPTTYGLDKSYDKRRETVAKALEKMGMSKEDIEAALAGEYTGEAPINPITGKPTTLVDRLGLFNQSQNLLNKSLSMADLIFEQQREEKRKSDPAFIEQQKIEKAAKDNRDFQQTVKKAADEKAARAREEGAAKARQEAAKKAADEKAARAREEGAAKARQEAARQAAAKKAADEKAARAREEGAAKARQEAARQAAEKKAADEKAAANRDAARGGGGGGGGGDFAGKGSGASGPAGRFSDKRLKENIELIGKSPSNINIYKFNYKNNPTTYQGVMADEVSWASVKHPNGYMMVDYNKIDVEFKKI